MFALMQVQFTHDTKGGGLLEDFTGKLLGKRESLSLEHHFRKTIAFLTSQPANRLY